MSFPRQRFTSERAVVMRQVDAPQSLSPDQVYAVAAFVLYLNHILPDEAALDASNLASVAMPNHSGFSSSDPRPDVDNKPCLQGCAPL